MVFDFDRMAVNVQGMRDMNPIKVTYKGVSYNAFRDILNEDLQMSLYGARTAVEITVGIPRAELKAEPVEGELVRVFTPTTGRKGKELAIIGIREDAGGLSVRLDCKARYDDE